MIAALVIVVVFAALMFLVAALNAQLSMRRTRNTFARARAWRRRDRALTVAATLLSLAVALVLVGVIW
jgi:uncharacterized protein involved in cysteine biosynthesis